EARTVSTYVVLMNTTAAAAGGKNADHDRQRTAIGEAFGKAGGKLVALTWTLGRYDLVATVEVDTDALNKERSEAGDRPITSQEVAAGFAYWLQSALGVRTETLIGLDEASMNAAAWVAERCGP